MKKNTERKTLRAGLLLSIAVIMVVTAMMGSAMAYFTTYATAKGGKVLKLGHQERITEELHSNEKWITITSEETSKSTYIRAKAICSSDHTVNYSGKNWTDGGDGWYYYNTVLLPGASTETLVAKVEIPKGDDFKVGDGFNVVVVYESADVRYEYEDNDPSKAASPISVEKIIRDENLKKEVWEKKVDTSRVSGGEE